MALRKHDRRMPVSRLDFWGVLQPQHREWLGFTLPHTSKDVLGTRGQARVIARVGGIRFETIAFPTGDDRHFVFLNARLRRRLGIVQGMRAHVQIQRAPARPPAAVPQELDAELSESRQAKLAWDGLTPAARQIASRWISSAKSSDVRRFRARDVVRRALRHHAGEGPFYPTQADQRSLARQRRR